MSKKIKIWVLAGFVIPVLFFVRQFFNHKFDSVESLQNYMKGFGIAAPLILTLFQAVQAVNLYKRQNSDGEIPVHMGEYVASAEEER